ncbi:MAG: hypothetical protein OXL98_12875 [Acidimicrobiaceae bacterium]|nr:hypothetical protein [Acidimicrobiaceae bacterium]MDE0162617.1 hypothetical protein [Acidimicrobiaceae bacterium]
MGSRFWLAGVPPGDRAGMGGDPDQVDAVMWLAGVPPGDRAGIPTTPRRERWSRVWLAGVPPGDRVWALVA